MKKQFLGIFVCLLVLVSCDNSGDPVTITLNESVIQLEVGDVEILEATVTPGSSSAVIWRSSDEAVATVHAGVVTAVSDGKVEITAEVNGQTAVCQCIVTRQGGTYFGEYKLVWEENFDGTSLNLDIWNIEVDGRGGGNQERQYYTDRPENLRVKDGNLEIEARRESYLGRDYTSGRIQTRGKVDFTYGKIEARISLPKGGGVWPAFWMMGYNGGWPLCGEIDIMEYVGNNPNRILHAVHTQARNGMPTSPGNWHAEQVIENAEGEFHVYGIEWLQDYEFGRDAIRFYVNDKVSGTVYQTSAVEDRRTWPFFAPHFIILNVALGGTMGGTIDNSIFSDPVNNPVMMKVDWIRAYQKSLD